MADVPNLAQMALFPAELRPALESSIVATRKGNCIFRKGTAKSDLIIGKIIGTGTEQMELENAESGKD